MSESRSWRFVQGQVDSEIKVISTIRKCKPPTTLTVNNNNDNNNTFFAFPQSSEPFNQNGSDLLFGRTRSALFFLFLHFFSYRYPETTSSAAGWSFVNRYVRSRHPAS